MDVRPRLELCTNLQRADHHLLSFICYLSSFRIEDLSFSDMIGAQCNSFLQNQIPFHEIDLSFLVFQMSLGPTVILCEKVPLLLNE